MKGKCLSREHWTIRNVYKWNQNLPFPTNRRWLPTDLDAFFNFAFLFCLIFCLKVCLLFFLNQTGLYKRIQKKKGEKPMSISHFFVPHLICSSKAALSLCERRCFSIPLRLHTHKFKIKLLLFQVTEGIQITD